MSEQATFQYYMNKRIDKLEETLQRQIDTHFEALETTINAHLVCCMNSRSNFEIRVGRLEGFKNRAVGAVALLVVLLGIWKATG